MIIAGNWKMNLLRQEAVALARLLDRDLADHPAEIIIFPATVLIPPVIEALGAKLISYWRAGLPSRSRWCAYR